MNKASRIDSPLKTGVISGVCLAVTAVIGLQASVPDFSAGRWAAVEIVRATCGNPALDLGGIVATVGASVLVMAWLHRESLRSPIHIRCPATYRLARPQIRFHVARRAAAISYHSGGLYGP